VQHDNIHPLFVGFCAPSRHFRSIAQSARRLEMEVEAGGDHVATAGSNVSCQSSSNDPMTLRLNVS
jgi:hypothetical protein